MTWCGVVWHGLIWFGLAWLGSTRLDSTRCGSVRFDSARLGLWCVVCGFGCCWTTFQEPKTVTNQQVALVFGHTVKPQTHQQKTTVKTTKNTIKPRKLRETTVTCGFSTLTLCCQCCVLCCWLWLSLWLCVVGVAR